MVYDPLPSPGVFLLFAGVIVAALVLGFAGIKIADAVRRIRRR